MGLDVTHGCWSAPYSAFARFREYIAEAAGVPLALMQGFYDEPSEVALSFVAPAPGGPACRSHHGPSLWQWIRDVRAWLPLSWESWEADPIVILLDHSDCEGDIDPADAGRVADRLEELRAKIFKIATDRSEKHGADHIDGQVGDWIRGLRAACAAGEKVEFH